jgi:hypothetical protein
VFEVARSFGNWRKKRQKSPHQTKLKAVVTLHGIFLITPVILSLILSYSLATLLLKIKIALKD